MRSKLKTSWVAGLALSSAALSVFLLMPKAAKAVNCQPGQCEAGNACYDNGFCLGSQQCSNGTWLQKGGGSACEIE